MEFFALLIVTSDRVNPCFAGISLSLRFPSGKVDQLPTPEGLNFGTPLSEKIQRQAGAKLIIHLRILLSDDGIHSFIFSAPGTVIEIPFTVIAKAN